MSERNVKVRLASLVCEHCHGSGGRDAFVEDGPNAGATVGFVPCPACDGEGTQYELVATSQDAVLVPDDEPCGDEIG